MCKDREIFQQLIAVTNRSLSVHPFEEQIERVASRHPRALILREKDLPEEEYRALAERVLAICAAHEVLCILHSYPETALALGCPAVHLPLPLLERYREMVPRFQAVGSSVHSVFEAKRAEELGAAYLTAGHIYMTDCKKGLAPRGLPFLREVVRAVSIPVYGIGGIGLDEGQLAEVLSCGAAGGCVMSAMMRI